MAQKCPDCDIQTGDDYDECPECGGKLYNVSGSVETALDYGKRAKKKRDEVARKNRNRAMKLLKYVAIAGGGIVILLIIMVMVIL